MGSTVLLMIRAILNIETIPLTRKSTVFNPLDLAWNTRKISFFLLKKALFGPIEKDDKQYEKNHLPLGDLSDLWVNVSMYIAYLSE